MKFMKNLSNKVLIVIAVVSILAGIMFSMKYYSGETVLPDDFKRTYATTEPPERYGITAEAKKSEPSYPVEKYETAETFKPADVKSVRRYTLETAENLPQTAEVMSEIIGVTLEKSEKGGGKYVRVYRDRDDDLAQWTLYDNRFSGMFRLVSTPSAAQRASFIENFADYELESKKLKLKNTAEKIAAKFNTESSNLTLESEQPAPISFEYTDPDSGETKVCTFTGYEYVYTASDSSEKLDSGNGDYEYLGGDCSLPNRFKITLRPDGVVYSVENGLIRSAAVFTDNIEVSPDKINYAEQLGITSPSKDDTAVLDSAENPFYFTDVNSVFAEPMIKITWHLKSDPDSIKTGYVNLSDSK